MATHRLGVMPLMICLAMGCSDEKEDAGKDLITSFHADSRLGRLGTPPDTTPPLLLTAFSVAAGARLGTVRGAMSFPSVHDYARIEIYRKSGSTPPESCTDGTLVTTVSEFSTGTFDDTALVPGEEYSYLACIYDAAGNTSMSAAKASVHAQGRQRFFLTSSDYEGNLKADFEGKSFATGLAGADARCQFHAEQAVLGGTWKALLSTDSAAARTRLPIYDGLYNVQGQLLASTVADLWDGELMASANIDETGTAVTDDSDAEVEVWTSSNSAGGIVGTYNCGEWTTAGNDFAYYGNALTGPNDAIPSRWVSYSHQTCSSKARLYCLEVDTANYGTATVTAASTDVSGTVSVELDFEEMGGTKMVKLVRQAGANFTNTACDVSSSMSSALRLKVVRSYNGTEASFDDQTRLDAIDFDSSGGFANEVGPYHYYACAFDAYGNVRRVVASEAVTTGTGYLRAFVSNSSFDGASVSIAAANADCQASAAAAGLSGTFRALLSDDVTSVTSNLNSGTPSVRYIFDLAGNYAGRATASNGYLFEGFGPTTKADGTVVASGTRIWTGSFHSGSYGNSCQAASNAWTSNSASRSGVAGAVSQLPISSGGYTYRHYLSCANSYQVWCVERN